MGIGNGATPPMNADEAYDSLPLMGIGNKRFGKAPPVTLTFVSLPLMGIGNLEPDATLRTRVSLITPHGDRKRSSPFVFLTQTDCETCRMFADTPIICAWPPRKGRFSAQAHRILSQNGPVLSVPLVFFLTHLPTEFTLAESLYYDVVAISGNEFQQPVVRADFF